ncbi:DUF1016 domain-containing protein [Chitinophaga lutea]|uniref:DUF1016 domain-containing protein n=1 Tax=Chitinophaga lutea TaxID=2488634 RepID=A0A3N4QB24_9BACT|nr:PDDEXK nuclease domain-containing protein [Chitinophaga lutea]RPE13187.1 DUF1016 domain-containing protein [Chitinophaga lutea]
MNVERQLLQDVTAILEAARSRAAAAVNTAMIRAYWLVGQRIAEQEQNGKRAAYGEALIKTLSRQLSGQFGSGFSVASLKSFRQFYLTFPALGATGQLPSALSWSHYRLIMRVTDTNSRNYYLREAAQQNWTVRQLDRNIQTLYYERLRRAAAGTDLSPTSAENIPPTIPPVSNNPTPVSTNTPPGTPPTNPAPPADSFFKDPYVFEFLNVAQPFSGSERDLETTLIAHLQHFLLELGKGFAFVGRQVRVPTETADYYVDLVFYNYLLKCFVLFDLKLGRLSHADVGQMDMYVRLFDELKRGEGDAFTLGVILCTDKDETVVRYSVLADNPRLFAARYQLYMPSESELIAEIERGLSAHRHQRQD